MLNNPGLPQFAPSIGMNRVTPLAAAAHQLGRVRRIAILIGVIESDPAWQAYLLRFRSELAKFGWAEGYGPDSGA